HAIEPALHSLLKFCPRCPCRALADKLAAPGNRNIFASPRVDQRRIVVALLPAPANENRRKIFGRITDESQRRAVSKMKLNVALEMDRPALPLPRGNEHSSATRLGAGIDGR